MSNTEVVIDLMKQWVVLADHTKSGPIHPKTTFRGPASRNYQLKNKQTRKFLQWEDQIGFNVGWTDDASPATATKVQRWFFMRQGENNTPIRYGETLAIGNGNKPSFMRYEPRTVGVNLQWVDDPVFEWKLLGGKRGTPINTGEYLALYNSKDNECFMYMDRSVGGDVGWPSSKTWGAQFQDKLGDLAGKALDKAIDAAITALLA